MGKLHYRGENFAVEPVRDVPGGSPADLPELRPELLPEPPKREFRRGRAVTGALVLVGMALGFGLVRAVDGSLQQGGPVAVGEVPTVVVESKRFESALRVGGTVGATNFAMIRAPRMRGSRDRGGGGGAGGAGGSGGSLTIQMLAEPGSIVQKGDVVAEFESKRTADFLDNYESNLAQVRTRSASRRANLLISAENLRQNHLKAEAEADKADLDLRTAEVKSKIQAEILALLAKQNRAAAHQLAEEVRLNTIADAAELRSLEIDVEQGVNRLQRTKEDLEKMRIRTPVSGLVVVESMFSRDGIRQANEGDQINPGSYFLRIVDLSRMAVFATVNQADSGRIALGAPVSVSLDAFPGAVFEGRVASVGAMAVATGSSGGGRGSRGGSRSSGGRWVREVPVEVSILATDDRIMPDLSASADILLETEDNAVVVPRAALGEVSGGYVVWVQESGGFVKRPVEIDLLSDTEATIHSGLRAGEVIAARPVADSDA